MMREAFTAFLDGVLLVFGIGWHRRHKATPEQAATELERHWRQVGSYIYGAMQKRKF
mgnify:CR=1 FL=1